MSETLRIDVPSAALALSLLERLDDLRAEVMPLTGQRYQVFFELDGDPGADRLLLESLDRIESWLGSAGLDLAEIHLNDRSYRLERRDGLPLRPRASSELDELVCRVRTIPLVGTGVQVVSAEGELDLHAATQLEEALAATDCARVVLDLTETPFIDSSALAVIVASSNQLREDGRELVVAAGNPTVSKVLRITGLDLVLKVRPTLGDAIASALDGLVGTAAGGDGDGHRR